MSLNSVKSNDAIAQLTKIAVELTGVQLNDKHGHMVQSRLQKRLQELGLKSFEEYLAYYRGHSAEESKKLIGLLTTHHTYFFREFAHFEFLLATALPGLVQKARDRKEHVIRIWCAAVSRGQEAYSLAMFLSLHLPRIDPSISFEIHGTDVDPDSVAIAKNGVYQRKELNEVPLTLLGSHWVRGAGEIADYVKAKDSLKKHCKFSVMNLLELSPLSHSIPQYDFIFCRNVFIYFNSQQIKSITQELLSHLSPGGYLFVGISESLAHLGLEVQNCGPSVYQLKSVAKPGVAEPAAVPAVSPAAAAAPSLPNPIRVVCVDDSGSILTLLKQILSDKNGFEIVGMAKNGEEAATLIAKLKPDAVTLDIHMPVMTGIEYLKKHHTQQHPPVVMVTSVSRDDADLAGQALSSGAVDFVEKPSLSNIGERGDELRTKLRCAVMARLQSIKVDHRLDRSFQKKRVQLTDTDSKLRVVVMSLSHRQKVRTLLAELDGAQPPIVLLMDGAKDNLPKIAQLLSQEFGKKIRYDDVPPEAFRSGEIYLLDMGSQSGAVTTQTAQKKLRTSILVFGDVTKASAEKLLSFSGAQLVLEDLGGAKGATALLDAADDIVPSTSFAYLSNEFFVTDPREKKAA